MVPLSDHKSWGGNTDNSFHHTVWSLDIWLPGNFSPRWIQRSLKLTLPRESVSFHLLKLFLKLIDFLFGSLSIPVTSSLNWGTSRWSKFGTCWGMSIWSESGWQRLHFKGWQDGSWILHNKGSRMAFKPPDHYGHHVSKISKLAFHVFEFCC